MSSRQSSTRAVGGNSGRRDDNHHHRRESRPPGRESRRELRRLNARKANAAIYNKMHRKDEEAHCFICKSDLERIWTDALLRDVIATDLTDKQIMWIRDSMLPFVSFIVWMGVEEWFEEFVERVFDNGPDPVRHVKLPISENALRDLGVLDSRFSPVRPITSQYCFIPAKITFDHEEPVLRVSPKETRLPFTHCNPNALHGGYGKVEFSTLALEYVEKVEDGMIYPYSHTSSRVVAVKSFQVREDATDEVRNLQLLKGSLMGHKSISLHSALIEHASQYLIIFPKAELGDLFQFLYPPNEMDEERRMHHLEFNQRFPEACKEDADIAHALLEQCYNIASALKYLHTPNMLEGVMTFCAHMDLKPHNILIFPGGIVGFWKICDFGISAFKEQDEEEPAPIVGSVGDLFSLASHTMRVVPKRSGGTYQAPEVYRAGPLLAHATEKDRRRVGRKGDIWSFGAIFAEVLSFALKRDKYVEEFFEKRVQSSQSIPKNDWFFDVMATPSQTEGYLLPEAPSAEYRVRPAVVFWLRKIAKDAASPRRYIDCWAETIIYILNVDMDRRPDAKELFAKVSHVLSHMRKARQSKEIPCEMLDGPAEITASGKEVERVVSSSSLPIDQDVSSASSSWNELQMPTFLDGETDPRIVPPEQPPSRRPPDPPRRIPPDTPPPGFYGPPPGFWSAQVGPTISFPATYPIQSLPAIIETKPSEPLLREAAAQAQDISPGLGIRVPHRDISDQHERHLSESTIASPSIILGRPLAAHGIHQNCGPDRQREPFPGHLAKISNLKNVKYLAVDATVPGSVFSAYLAADSIYVYEMDLAGTHDKLSIKEVAASPEHLRKDRTPKGKANEWKGVSLAWPYLVAWGKNPMGYSLLHLARLSRDHHTTLMVPEGEDLRYFDHTKRAAVSPRGLVALIKDKKVLMVDMSRDPPELLQKTPESRAQPFTDIIFNDCGDLLHAWTTGGAQRLAGALLVYRVTREDKSRPESKGYYECLPNDEGQTKLFPYNDYHGCIIAANSQDYYPAIIKASHLDDKKNLVRHINEQLTVADVRAATMFNDHSLIVVQKGLFHRYLVEYPLEFDRDRDAPGVHHLGEPQELSKLKIDAPGNLTQVRAVQHGDDIYVIIMNAAGHIEWHRYVAVKVKPDEGNGKGKGKQVDIRYG